MMRPLWFLFAVVACASASAAPGAFVLLQDSRPCKGLEVAACRGEFEPVRVTVLALQDLAGLTVKATVPGVDVDARVVKWWWQAGREVWDLTHKRLVPELLLRDDAMVRVEGTENYLRDGDGKYLLASGKSLAPVTPRDAATLLPVSIPEGEAREFWLTVHVPQDAASGTYRGVARFSCAGRVKSLPMRVTVRSFDLEPAPLTYSLYYRAHLQDGPPVCNSDDKTLAQYKVEIENMRDHGVLYPANYQGFEGLERTLAIRREAGLPAGKFYTLGCNPGSTPEELANIRKWLALLAKWGYTEVYFYGEDEATGDQLTAQKERWRATQSIGARTFVAGYSGTFEAMGGLLNCAVFFGRPTPEEAAKWHSVGSTVLSYANPQVGVEDALVYRRNYGLALWRSGFDGCMDYAYQHAFTNIWNDFDDPDYRDHVFAYPTVDGVVDTVQWEGFREGVDDTRYLATLQKAIAEATDKTLAATAQRRIDRLDVAGDLDVARAMMCEWIVRLREGAVT
jgi:hypothetical protein